MLVSATVWVWETIALYRMSADDRAFYDTQVAPKLEAQKRNSDAWMRAFSDRSKGKMAVFPPIEMMDVSLLNETVERSKRQFPLIERRLDAMMTFWGATLLMMFTALVDGQLRRQRREAPDRPADKDAGKLVGELVQLNKQLVARAPGGADAHLVEIDGHRAIVAFHNFTFVRAFVGNPKLKLVELPFTDILSVFQEYYKGRAFLTVRTTRGRVVMKDNLHPFQTLADVLADIVELNRTSPESYAAAVAREPKVNTPWYGWLIIAAAVGAVVYVGWKVM